MSQQEYRVCSHEDRFFMITYKTGESTKLLCQACRDNPDFVNDTAVESIHDIRIGDKSQ